MKSVLLTLLASGPLFAQQTMNLPSNKVPQAQSQIGTASRLQPAKSNVKIRPLPEVPADSFKNKPTDQNEISSKSRALGGADPGGGGAYNINGQLKTLAEAGAILEKASQLGSKVYPKYYTLKPETIDALREIISQLPFLNAKYSPNFKSFADEVIGKRGTFIDQNDVSKPEYEKIKSDYRKVIRSYGKELDEASFILVAYGKPDTNKTYILPAFEELSSFQQALILIHEYFMRKNDDLNSEARLELVLNLDVIILDIVKNGYTVDSKLRFLTALERLKVISKRDLGYYRLALLEKRLGRPIFASELVLEPTFFKRNKIDPSLVQKFESQMPGIAQYFERWELKTEFLKLFVENKAFLDLQNSKREAVNKAMSGNREDLEKAKELQRAEREYIDQFEQKVKSICKAHSPQSSGVDDDFLISSSLDEGRLVRIDCENPILSREIHLMYSDY